ncbi:MAG TPA: iron-siderophore ABC transporter substrate-binding protein [Azospirillaceae bacterium]|nr:iron-siderophore ABC transporter substrate-binding protein [Azospirillaceae bacterium]
MKLAVSVLALLLSLPFPVFAVTVSDSRGPQDFAKPPERVIVLSWELVEQVLQLDITPVAIADSKGYRTWVVRPHLPDGVDDVGTRQEPNLEKIAELRPDLILASDEQNAFVAKLEAIAPVLHFDAFKEDHNNYLASREIYKVLARLFGREELAQRRLDDLDQRLSALKVKLSDHFQGKLPKVTPARFIDGSRVRVHGANSMAQYALEALGIENGFPQAPSTWGFALRKIEELSQAKDGYVIHIEPFPQAENVFSTQLWAFMPFVKGGRFTSIPSTWTFGGPFSVGLLAEAFADALMKAKP